MRKLLFALALLCFASAPASTQLTISGIGGGFGGAATYVGPGDIVSGAKIWYSCSFGYNAADTSPTCNVCLPADTTCADLTLSSGVAVVPGSLSTCNITTVICTVKTIYDKGSLASNITNATEANRPTFRPAMASNGCPTTSNPCIKFTAASSQVLVSGSLTIAQPSTSSFVYLDTTANVGFYDLVCCTLRLAAGPQWVLDNGNTIVSSTFSTATWYADQIVNNSTTSTIRQNGSSIASGDTGTSGPSGQTLSLGKTSALFADIVLGEFGVWPVAFNGTQQANMETNERTTRWGF